MNIKSTVHQSISQIASEKSLQLPRINDQDALVDDLGFTSLDVATLIALLEDTFNVDPFTDGSAAITDLRTVGDLCKIYEVHATNI